MLGEGSVVLSSICILTSHLQILKPKPGKVGRYYRTLIVTKLKHEQLLAWIIISLSALHEPLMIIYEKVQSVLSRHVYLHFKKKWGGGNILWIRSFIQKCIFSSPYRAMALTEHDQSAGKFSFFSVHQPVTANCPFLWSLTSFSTYAFI